ncbi:MAG TPA: 3-deoxy-D-manno-octulosonic acid transferase [Aquabacterium sp.]|nr:3-deoxy-D-manno-octulosonic acid transferase [Aquabacterium sp.]
MIKQWLARQAYSLLLRLGTPVYLWRVWHRGKTEPLYRAVWWERLGVYGAAHRHQVAMSGQGPWVWVHAVSLGETRAVAPLVQALRTERPGMRLLLTHSTATGREAGRSLLQPGDAQTWLPYDTPGAVRRFLRAHRPAVGVLMETEVWPNVQAVAAQEDVPVVLANGRLSEKSLKQGLRLAALMAPAAQSLAVVLAQTQADAERFRQMGARDVRVTGNVKFDVTPANHLLSLGAAWKAASQGRPIVLMASSREGEEPGLLAAWTKARSDGLYGGEGAFPRLWIVPRHPQRFDEVAQLVAQAGWSLSRRSTWSEAGPDAVAQEADVWLGDSIGEMPAYYAAANVALLGGSFEPLGGQNLIEAAACGCPIVMGPSTFNFAEAAELSERAGAAIRVSNWGEGVAQALRFCDQTRQSAGRAAAYAFAGAHKGAATRSAKEIWAQVLG